MELNDFFISRIALICAVLGLIILFYFSIQSAYAEKGIEEISNELIGSRVSVKGFVEDKFFAKETLFFKLSEGRNSIQVVKFNPSVEDFEEVKGNSFVEVRGSVQEYKKNLEIIAEEVKRVGYE
ncbi:MAG: OB-fold nucleic acid binding domain-containing protein [archaeon]